MNLFSIAYKSIKQRLLSSLLTAVSVALGVMLLVAVLVFHGIVERSFGQEGIFYDLIIGPKQGSDLQVVLATYYRIADATDTIPYRYYDELRKDPRVRVAIPIAVGDTTDKGDFPIVGTTGKYFETPYAPGRRRGKGYKFQIRFKEGYQNFNRPFSAIIGSEVAKKNDWDIGAQFRLIHSGNQSHIHKEKFTVIGVMQQTGTPNDKTVFIRLRDFYAIADHGRPENKMRKILQAFYGKTYTEEEWDDLRRERYALRELSAVFVVVQRPPADEYSSETDTSAAFHLKNEIKDEKRARAVNPVEPIRKLKDNVVGNIRIAMVILVSLIIAVSGVSIFVSIYNSMADRKREIAIMRALGARRQTVFSIILAESVLLCFGGGIAGIVLGHGLVFAAAPIVAAKTKLLIDPFAFETLELILLPAMIVMASLVGFVPGMTAYRTDVAEALGD